MVTGGSPLPSRYLPLTDPASAAASSAASLASAVTAGDRRESQKGTSASTPWQPLGADKGISQGVLTPA